MWLTGCAGNQAGTATAAGSVADTVVDALLDAAGLPDAQDAAAVAEVVAAADATPVDAADSAGISDLDSADVDIAGAPEGGGESDSGADALADAAAEDTSVADGTGDADVGVPPDSSADAEAGAPETAETGSGATDDAGLDFAEAPDAGDASGTADVADTADSADAAADPTACATQVELCDGIDNNCNGATDEDLGLAMPGGPEVFPVGGPCICPGGTVICKTLTISVCSACPPNADQKTVLAAPGAQASPLVATGGFVDIGAELGLTKWPVHLGTPLLEPAGYAPLAIDTDQDGDIDLLWVDGDHKLLLQTRGPGGSWTTKTLLDLPGETLVAVAAMPGPMGPDVLVGGSVLLRLVRQADGQYLNQQAGLTKPPAQVPVQHLLPADLNGDGVLDLLVALYPCNSPEPSYQAWIQCGEGGFVQQTASLGLAYSGALWATLQTDLDNDGWLDLLVLPEGCPAVLGIGWYRNQGPLAVPQYALQALPPTFVAPGPANGSPMGAAQADVNRDGVLDYLLAEIELYGWQSKGKPVKPLNLSDLSLYNQVSNRYLLSQPGGGTALAGLAAGLWAPLSSTGKTMTAWAVAWLDIDRDGHHELLMAHGYEHAAWITADAGGMRPVAFRSDGLGQFVDASTQWGLPADHPSRTLSVADLDGDGDADLALGGQACGPTVLRNDVKAPGTDLTVRLVGTASNAWGLGARLVLTTSQRKLTAEHSVQAQPQSMATPESRFGLMANEVATKLQVTWPSGWVSQLPIPSSSGPWTVVEPPLWKLTSRWSPGGATPVTVDVYVLTSQGQPDPTGGPCQIELAPGALGGWTGPTTCSQGKCSRTWQGSGLPSGGSAALVLGCNGKAWALRPRIFY